MSADDKKLTPCYILHRRPFRESSVILDVVAEGFGLISVILKGAQAGGKGKSAANSALAQPFRPLLLDVRGSGEMKSAYAIEDNGPLISLQDKHLYSGFYVNELICRLWPKNVENEELYELYQQVLHRLNDCQREGSDRLDLERALRHFELEFLVHLGFAIDCFYTIDTGDAVVAQKQYIYDPEYGFSEAESHEYYPLHQVFFAGADVLAIGNLEFTEPSTLRTAKQLTRMALAKHLGSKPLKSRELFIRR